MPELPEVETVKKILNTIVPGAKIVKVEVFKPGIIIGDVEIFVNTLTGRTFHEVERIGKYLIFTFDTSLVMLSHLRMEGKFIEKRADQENSRYGHVIFTLADGRRICYDDSRQFGKMELSTREDYLKTKSLLNVGPEPFTINEEKYYKKIKSRATPIKLTLLDQKLMSGLGNIYVDEVLYLSRIHPLTPTNLITKDQVHLLIQNSIEVLNAAIKQGGTTVRSYSPAAGVSGNFQQELHAYGKADQRCKVCNAVYKKIFVGGRGTTYCPTCQVNPASPILIAITGQKASGKSEILKYLKSIGEQVYDTDTIAKELYKDERITKKLEVILGTNLHENDVFSLDLLRSYLLENPKKLKDLNAYLHPLVKEKIMGIISNNSAKRLYFEIPLLFSVKINELFHYLVGVEVSLNKQKENLARRGQELGINPDAMYLKNRHRLDYILINDGSVDDLINKFKALKI